MFFWLSRCKLNPPKHLCFWKMIWAMPHIDFMDELPRPPPRRSPWSPGAIPSAPARSVRCPCAPWRSPWWNRGEFGGKQRDVRLLIIWYLSGWWFQPIILKCYHEKWYLMLWNIIWYHKPLIEYPRLSIFIWLVSTYPSEKWWRESQLGWWNSQYMEK